MAAPARGGLSSGTALLLVTPLVLLLLFALFSPLAMFLSASFLDPQPTLEHYTRLLFDDLYWSVLLETLWIAGVVTLAALVLGYPIAMLMARVSGWWAVVIAACVLIPLWTPVLIRSYAWIILMQRRGLINQGLEATGLVERPLSMLYTTGAVVLAMTHVLMPFMILPIQSSLRAIPRDLDQAALGLGASRFQTFREVIWPLSLPGVMAGCLMVFVISLGFYITPALLGGPTVLMIATLVSQQAFEFLNWPFAAAISTVLMVITLGITVVFRRILKVDRLSFHA